MSVRPRGNKWQVRVTVDGVTACKSFTLKSEAEKWERHQRVAMERGEYQPPAPPATLASAIERYERDCLPSKRGAAQESYVLAAWKLMMGARPLASIKPADIAQQRDILLQRLSCGSVRRYLDVLSGVFQVAIREWEMLATNPVRAIRKPAAGRARDRRVSSDEVARIIAATQSKDLPAVVRLALETAMRRSEILGLEWQHVDLDRRVAYLPLTKNGDARTVPLTRRAVEVLRDLPRRPDGMVFKHNGTSLSEAFRRAATRARAQYEKERIAAGVSAAELAHDKTLIDIRLHDCRHERVSVLVEAGFNLAEVAAVSGHKTLQCLKRYTHIRPDHLVARLDSIAAR